MLILAPILLTLTTSLVLLILWVVRPKFRYAWLIAAGGALFALAGVFLWQIRLPQEFSLLLWEPQSIFTHNPTWLVDDLSWPFSLSLMALTAAVILTSVVRNDRDPITWAGILLLSAMGLISITAANPITLMLAWSAIDLSELLAMLRSSEGKNSAERVVIAFASRLAGTGLLFWASISSPASASWSDLNSSSTQIGIFLLLAAGLRLGVLPLHLPYRQENVFRRGYGTGLRLVSAASSLILLARLPASIAHSQLTPYLLILAAVTAIYAGWLWLRASDELTGRPFWIMGMASLTVCSALRANPTGSVGWGIALLLGGGTLFLYSARHRKIVWLPILAMFGLSSLSYSATAAGWQSEESIFPLLWIIFIPAQALLMAGYIRHTLHPGESSLESQPRWAQVIYPLGLALLVIVLLLLGIWGWDGARQVGTWIVALITLMLVFGLSWFALKMVPRLSQPDRSSLWGNFPRMGWIYPGIRAVYRLLSRLGNLFTNTLEGDGGILWSLLLIVLMMSIFSSLR